MPACFKISFQDFTSTLIDHEYIHAEHVKFGIKFDKHNEYNYLMWSEYSVDTVLLLDESIAYNVTLIKAREKKNHSKFIEDSKNILQKITTELKKISKYTSVAEENAVKSQIQKNEKVLSYSST